MSERPLPSPISAAVPAERPAKVPLRGRWVTLDPLSTEHAGELWPIARDEPESWTRLPFGPFARAEDFRIFVTFMAASQAEMVWTVRRHSARERDATAAGWVALLDIQPAHATLELGNIWFPPGLARTRAATEALYLLLAYAFDSLSYQRIAWKCDPAHGPSRSAAQRLGLRFEGILRSHLISKRRRRDTAYFSLLAEEWPDRRAALREWLSPTNFDASGNAITKLKRIGGAA